VFKLPYRISIDNLTMIGYPTQRTLKLLETSPLVEKHWTTPNQRYHYNFSLIFGGFIQIKHEGQWQIGGKTIKLRFGWFKKPNGKIVKFPIGLKKSDEKSKAVGKPMRLEFNPNKYRKTGGSEKYILELIATMNDIHLSRKDIAIDIFDHDLNDYMIIDERGRKIIEYKDSSRRLETMYLGSKESEEQLRIYDKALEQGMNQKCEVTGKKPNIKWWRIEGQMRGDSAKEYGVNPFRKVRIVKKSDYRNLPIKDRALLLLLQADPDSIKELSKNSRTKYKKMLEEDVTEVSILPDKIFFEHMEDLESDIQSWITWEKGWNEEGNIFNWNPQKDFSKSVLKEGNTDPAEELKKEALENIRKWVSGE
jgi:hypothetical protein